jgi:hypothetical protein
LAPYTPTTATFPEMAVEAPNPSPAVPAGSCNVASRLPIDAFCPEVLLAALAVDMMPLTLSTARLATMIKLPGRRRSRFARVKFWL